jgi:hypothetical protein
MFNLALGIWEYFTADSVYATAFEDIGFVRIILVQLEWLKNHIKLQFVVESRV